MIDIINAKKEFKSPKIHEQADKILNVCYKYFKDKNVI